MRSDIQDALLSVAEVAIFAWSLLELLLTRILPLAGFLVGHLLLEFGSLLTSVVIATAGRRHKPRAEYSWDEAEGLIEEDNVQAEGLIEEDNVQEDGDDDDQNKAESLKSSDEHEESQRISREKASILPSSTDAEEADAAPYPHVQPVIDHHAAANEPQLRDSDIYGHLAESAPSDDQCQAEPPLVGIIEQGHVSSKGERSADKMGSEPSDAQRSAISGTSEVATSPASSTDEGEVRQRNRRGRMRVLPPSLSQVKRTLMQRSRRASPSTSPALLAPSPSPINKKRGSRRSASSAIKSSASYDNFTRKFRKHFLLDAA